jgi:uncharacterized repeat protein (TIGR01451 family)
VTVGITASADTAVVGDQVEYSATVTDNGPLQAAAVTLDLRPPEGAQLVSVASPDGACTSLGWLARCSFTRLADGASATATLVVRVTQTGLASARARAAFDGCISAACGSALLRDPNPANGAAAAIVSVLATRPPARRAAPGLQLLARLPDGVHPAAAAVPALRRYPYRNFPVPHSIPNADPQSLDGNDDGIGCTFDDY